MDCGYLCLSVLNRWVWPLFLRDSFACSCLQISWYCDLVWVGLCAADRRAGVVGFEGLMQGVDTVCLLRVVVVWCCFQPEVEGVGQVGDGNENGAWEGCARSR